MNSFRHPYHYLDVLALATLIVAVTACNVAPSPITPGNTLPPRPTSTLGPPTEIVLQGENGSGDGQSMQRSQALKQKTVWLHDGETRILRFQISATASYRLNVRYSNDNDNTKPSETIEVRIDNESIGTFKPKDTGDGGHGWNVFETIRIAGPTKLSAGSHEIIILVSGGDGYGVEIDAVILQPTE